MLADNGFASTDKAVLDKGKSRRPLDPSAYHELRTLHGLTVGRYVADYNTKSKCWYIRIVTITGDFATPYDGLHPYESYSECRRIIARLERRDCHVNKLKGV